MRDLRPVNVKIGNLRGYAASRVVADGDRLAIQFDSTMGEREAFCVLLEGVLDFADHGLLRAPLTAGIVWRPVGAFGSAVAARRGVTRVEGLIEMRLDYEDRTGLVCRFQAVAAAARAWEGALDQVSNS
ncbi:MAG TPA: hypothetical protein VKA60_15780 [Blastocatellia bacterium]|nr:hypothetical protein [Blastocatellia bacterium]